MSIVIKNIGDLKELSFFVPSYQRGYRWTEYEVTALLDDVNEFSTEGDKKYCIQPLIVKRLKDNSFEVVDGQQRLTTIYIFMKIAEEKTEYVPFGLEFQTRPNSQIFLSNLAARGDINNDFIDYFYITTARETINNWLDKQKNRYIAINRIFERFIESVIFIWYELPSDSDPIDMFTKVNLGKIPLTNAELIKALLLNKDNFLSINSNEEICKKQYEISLAWDRIEQGLHNDSFWYFLNQKEHGGTRIDMLFELLAKDYNERLSVQILPEQNYFSFLVFSASMDNESERDQFVKLLWNAIEKLYAEFRSWYDDLNKYHIIGYLITTGVHLSEIFDLSNGERKSAFTVKLLERAQKTLSVKFDRDTLANLSYRNDSPKIRRILLLFNIATLVCKSEKQYRFPFDIYKGETGEKLKWDIEHIHATADETDEPDDSMWNLTLLERGINRSPLYAAKAFDEKRKVIISRESKGLFVPVCTMNIFLKVYSNDLSTMDIWGSSDKLDYISEIAQALQFFFEGSF